MLEEWWSRKVDIYNRGLSGYNTVWALPFYEDLLKSTKPDLLTIFFGANDAVSESTAQHVEQDTYRLTLQKMIDVSKRVTIIHHHNLLHHHLLFLLLKPIRIIYESLYTLGISPYNCNSHHSTTSVRTIFKGL